MAAHLRQRLVQAVAGGSSARQAAARVAVSPTAVHRLMRRVRVTGSTQRAKIGGYRKPLLAGQGELLRALVAGRKGITLAKIQAELVRRGIEPGSLTTIWSTLRRLGLSQEKTLRATEQDRPDVARRRQRWCGWQPYMDPASFVLSDAQAPKAIEVSAPIWSAAESVPDLIWGLVAEGAASR